MIVIKWEETLEDKLRRIYNIPMSVETNDVHKFIGTRLAKKAMDKVKIESSR